MVPQGELSISDLGSGLRYYLELQPSEPSRHKFLAFRQGAWSECCALPHSFDLIPHRYEEEIR